MAKQDFIPLNRCIQNNWLWQEKPYSKGQAWVDLLLLANYKDTKIPYRGEIVVCKRGDVNLSITSLAKKWGWSRDKARRFLMILERDKMVTINSTTHRTTITIENYTKYQDWHATNNTTDNATSSQQADTTKKDKKDKNIYSAFFEQIWKLYPKKKGKGSVSDSKKKTLYDIGLEEMTRCIERYKEYIADKDMQYVKDGSTFFNSGYVDYLDANFEEKEKTVYKIGG